MRDRIAPGAAFLASTRNGLRACEGTDLLTAQGVFMGSLEEAAATATTPCAPGARARAGRRGQATALWNALWRGGCYVHVPAGVDAAVPVVAAHSAAGDHAAVFPATVVVLGRARR